ncbi:MAG TPA: hypothetical protein VN736_28690 [Candidatus Limnocylindrales bacterium]|jgi:hypothetical protein|nr:hypothetical protein [Candidatus Limnocylindrales bacterium]
MSAIATPSFTLHEELLAALTGGFNDYLATAAGQIGVPAYALNWSKDPDGKLNCFEGEWLFAELIDMWEPVFPAVAWWVAAGADQNVEKGRAFSGRIQVAFRFFLGTKGKHNTDKLEGWRYATEAAIVATLRAMVNAPCAYSKDISWSDPVPLDWLDRDSKHIGWVKQVDFRASFEVNV